MFVWVYGLFLAGYQYSLKMFVFQKVRARNFPSAWGFIQLSQAVSVLVGVPITGYINHGLASKAGYYFSALTVLLGAAILALIDLQRRLHRNRKRGGRRLRERASKADGKVEVVVEDERRGSLPDVEEDDFLQPGTERSQLFYDDIMDFKKPELTCISEEGIADMDLPDNILEELEYLDNITSCAKVENCLMLSEYEQNLIKEKEGPVSLACRRARKWSLVRQGQ